MINYERIRKSNKHMKKRKLTIENYKKKINKIISESIKIK